MGADRIAQIPNLSTSQSRKLMVPRRFETHVASSMPSQRWRFRATAQKGTNMAAVAPLSRILVVTAVTVGLTIAGTACGKGASSSSGAGTSDEKKSAAEPTRPAHGVEMKLGHVTVAGFVLEVSRLGPIVAGADSAVAAKVLKAPVGKDWKTVNLYVWVEDADGGMLNAPERSHVEDGRLHAHAFVPAKSKAAPDAIVFRVRDGATDERAKLPLAGKGGTLADAPKGHSHDKTPHDGMQSVLETDTGSPIGWVELKLHDDRGDLELWLATDKSMAKAFALSAATAEIVVTFADHANRRVQLAPRDLTRNPDESGVANMRDGLTHYFVFPGKTGMDASWLKGKAFQSVVTVTVKADGKTWKSREFVLKPHTHTGAGH